MNVKPQSVIRTRRIKWQVRLVFASEPISSPACVRKFIDGGLARLFAAKIVNELVEKSARELSESLSHDAGEADLMNPNFPSSGVAQ